MRLASSASSTKCACRASFSCSTHAAMNSSSTRATTSRETSVPSARAIWIDASATSTRAPRSPPSSNGCSTKIAVSRIDPPRSRPKFSTPAATVGPDRRPATERRRRVASSVSPAARVAGVSQRGLAGDVECQRMLRRESGAETEVHARAGDENATQARAQLELEHGRSLLEDPTVSAHAIVRPRVRSRRRSDTQEGALEVSREDGEVRGLRRETAGDHRDVEPAG